MINWCKILVVIAACSVSVCLFVGGGMSIRLGVEGGKENIPTNCTVIKQDVVVEECAYACRTCNGDKAPGEPCGCMYSSSTDYVTWEYAVNNYTYTTNTKICTDGEDAFKKGYKTTCWYNKNYPRKVQIITGPGAGRLIMWLGIVCIIVGIIIIVVVIRCFVKHNKLAEYTELPTAESPDKIATIETGLLNNRLFKY